MTLTPSQREEVAAWILDLADRASQRIRKEEPKNRAAKSITGFAEVLAAELRGEDYGSDASNPDA